MAEERRVAIVTGAASGIGRAMTLGLLSGGIDVAAVDKEPVWLDELKAAASGRSFSGALQTIRADLTDSTSFDTILSAVLGESGRIDILVNNAGSRQNFKTIDELPEDEWDAVVDVNLKGTFLCSREAARLMMRNGGGAVVNVASIAGPVAFPRIGAYCAAKAGVVALTKVMAAEWADHHIRVNAVAPGWIESPMNVELRTEPKNVEMFAHLRNQTFLKRFGRPREVADVVTFLASPAASYIDGEVIFIDGGWTAV